MEKGRRIKKYWCPNECGKEVVFADTYFKKTIYKCNICGNKFTKEQLGEA